MFVLNCTIPIVDMPTFAWTVGTEGTAFTLEVRYCSPTGSLSPPKTYSVPANGVVSHSFDPSSERTYFPNECGAVKLLAQGSAARFSAWARPKPGEDWHCVSSAPHMERQYEIPYVAGTTRLKLAVSNLGGPGTVGVRKKGGGFSDGGSLAQNNTYLWTRDGSDVSAGGILEVTCTKDIAVCLYGETSTVKYHAFPDGA